MRLVPGLTRRDFMVMAGASALAPLLPREAAAALETGKPLHGISAFGDLKYGPDFTHFDYASPDAPKGGVFNFSPPNWGFNQSTLTFNTLNSFVLRGDAPPRMEMCFDGLMGRALDEPDSLYGLAAETVTVSDDRNSFDFRIRPEAAFHDGSALTAEDVAFSYRLLAEEGHPDFLLSLRDMKAAEADGETFRLVLNGRQSPRLILSLVTFPIFSKTDIEANGFEGSGLRPLLGSGPYKVGDVFPGRSIEYDRVPDYWARDLPINRGFYHFDMLRIEFFGDRQAAFEAFKKGIITYRQEFTSRVWATGYNFPAIEEGKVVKRTFPQERTPSMQAWAVNQRRERFADPRMRQAIGLCFDFEWTRRNLFYGSYERSQSTFERSPYKAKGLPSAQELAIMEPLRGKIPEEAFGEAVTQPISDGSGRDRALLTKASQLLTEMGWVRENGIFTRNGERLTLEILVQDEVFVRVDTPFVRNLRAIGFDASIRLVDPTQYEYRLRDFDFDMIGMAASFTATPSRDALISFFHSEAAELNGSSNYPGTADPAVDSLIDLAGAARNREDLTNVMLVLDRVLRARRDWIPNWHAANHRAAFWDMFGYKEPKPDYGFPVEAMWWYDEEKAKAIGQA